MIPPRHDDHRTWVRKVDGTMHVVKDQPNRRWYPGNLTELLYLVKGRIRPNEEPEPPPVGGEAKVCGSHWAMSCAAVTPGQMIETATPVHEGNGDQTAPRLNNVLHEVIPKCMTEDAIAALVNQDVLAFEPTEAPNPEKFYLFHVEAGMRIYELYAYMDSCEDDEKEESLARHVERWIADHNADRRISFRGPWALPTMGGAGGQTIAGVASTATHGGDVGYSAIGDAIVAIHLIAPDGQEYWLERETILPGQVFDLVDEGKLQQLYAPSDPSKPDPSKPGGEVRTNKIIRRRDDDLVNAAIVSCGRMGIIYSVVVRAIRQFALAEQISTPFWNDVRGWIADVTDTTNKSTFTNHFVQVDVDVYPKPVFDWHTAAWLFATGITAASPLATVGLYAGLQGNKYRAWKITRQLVPLDKANTATSGKAVYRGRAERGAPNTKGAMPDLQSQDEGGSFRNPCGTAKWLHQALQDMNNQLETIRNDAFKAWLAAGTAAAATTITAPAVAAAMHHLQGILLRVMLFCQTWILLLGALRSSHLGDEMHFGDFVSWLLNTFSGLHARPIVQILYWVAANSLHPDPAKPATAISYAIMDTHNYQNKGCVAPGDSIEFFLDATTPALPSFVDYLLGQVRTLADEGLGFGGYISMRFMKDSPSFLAMQRWPRTCSIEIAGLSKASGTGTYMKRIEEESRKRNIILHWGQRNNRKQIDLEKIFSPDPGEPFHRWRQALSELTEHGRLHHFSTDYTRVKGLEITTPRLYKLSASLTDGCEDDTTTISYNVFRNPPETQFALSQRFRDGRVVVLPVDTSTPYASVQIALGRGRSTIRLEAERELNEIPYGAPPLEVELYGMASGDTCNFAFEAERRQLDGAERWYVEMNGPSQFISDRLRVSAITLTTSGSAGGDWILRNPDLGTDLTITAAAPTVSLPSPPVFNRNWRFFSQTTPTTPPSFPGPTVFLTFTITC